MTISELFQTRYPKVDLVHEAAWLLVRVIVAVTITLALI